ncbi:MAG: hypothetical protein KG075_09465 [Alphaproteobacteria bacterium]|nr:hypothetical protein [Alphaproteobacteria bacterium]
MLPHEMTRAAARKTLVSQMRALAAEYGADFEARPDGRGFHITIRLPGAMVCEWVDACTAKVGAFLGHWVADRNRKFVPGFGAVIGGSLNTFHFGKATTHAYVSDRYLALLRAGLAAVKSGAAFQQQ